MEQKCGGNTSYSFYLNNALGYLWAEEELHRIAAIYGHGDGADLSQTVTYYYGGPNDQDGSIEEGTVEAQQGRKTTLSLDTPSGARSITREDINKICGKDSIYTVNYFRNEQEKNADNATYYPTLNTPNTTTGVSEEVTAPSGIYYHTTYDYTVSSVHADSAAKTKQDEMLKMGTNYHLASREWNTGASMGGGRICGVSFKNKVGGWNTAQCQSGGSWQSGGAFGAVRALVILKSGIQTSDTEYDSTVGWNLIK